MRSAMVGALALLPIATAGCSGKVGVRAVITLPNGVWSDGRPFDHIRVQALSKKHVEVACLFPLDNVGPDGIVSAAEAASNDLFACADQGPAMLDEALGAAAWGLEHDGTRSVNFQWSGSDTLTLSASAGFGGKIDLLTATASADAASSFPDVALVLGSPAVDFFGTASCPLHLSKVAHELKCPAGEQVGCLFPPDGTRHHTAGMFPVVGVDASDPKRAACRTFNAAKSCGDPALDPAVTFTGVVDVPAFKNGAKKTSLFATLRGRFARCASGDLHASCAVTTNCTPPYTGVAMTARNPNDIQPPTLASFVAVSCLPPTAGMVEVRFPVGAKTDAINVGVLAQDLSLVPSKQPCFFDLLDFDYDFAEK